MDNFEQISQFIEEMKATSSTNDKKEIIKKYDSQYFRQILKYTYHPFKGFCPNYFHHDWNAIYCPITIQG